jgi:hypothetical protein
MVFTVMPQVAQQQDKHMHFLAMAMALFPVM